MKIDLHTHTYYSDGFYSPADLIKKAIEEKVEIIAITDHDVTLGVNEAIKAAKNKIKVIVGIEFSCKCLNNEIHMLGLYIDPESKEIKEYSNKIIEQRKRKTLAKIKKINEVLKLNLTYEEVLEKTKGTPGTAHIAMVLMDKKIVKSVKEGIFMMMESRFKTDFKEEMISAEAAIKMIHDTGGIAVLAHLAAYKNIHKFVTYEEQEELVKGLKKYKMDGLEVYIPKLSEEDRIFEENLAKKYNLLVSGGSDFHNERDLPDNKLGFIDMDKKKISVLK